MQKFRGCDIPTALKELRRESLARPESICWCLLPPSSHTGNAADEGAPGGAPPGAGGAPQRRENPLRFHLLVVPPKQKDAAKDIYFYDGIYVDSTSFRLWRHKEASLRALIQWWKQNGYWNVRERFNLLDHLDLYRSYRSYISAPRHRDAFLYLDPYIQLPCLLLSSSAFIYLRCTCLLAIACLPV